MTLDEIKGAIDQLSPEERAELSEYIAQDQPRSLSPQERAELLERGVAAIRDSMTPAELDELVEAINTEYIEPWDEEEWIF